MSELLSRVVVAARGVYLGISPAVQKAKSKYHVDFYDLSGLDVLHSVVGTFCFTFVLVWLRINVNSYALAAFVAALKSKGYSCIPEDAFNVCMEIIEVASRLLANDFPRHFPPWTIPGPGESSSLYEPDLPKPITGS